mmetsp:Transcript_3549/g.7604  ORF Transcript_3549/g.7604 Transcript_3549/m.7604 type:complete len:118 (-) Transcript_3549:210-563(-)
MADEPLKCPFCAFFYSAKEHKPLLLPWCGHNICRACAREYGPRFKLACKVCSQTGTFVQEASVTNYALIEMIELLIKRGLISKGGHPEIEVSYSKRLSDLHDMYQSYPRSLPEKHQV